MKRINISNLKTTKHSGITLIALVITIIVLLILAGVTISVLTGDNGLLTKASNAKSASEIGEEKEIIALSTIQAKAEKYNENLDRGTFQSALDSNSRVENKAEIIEADEESFIIQFEGSKRFYEVDQNGNVELIEATGGKKLTVECKDSNKNVLATKEYTILKNDYSKSVPVIEGYIAEKENISGTITEDTTIEVLYYYEIPETQMVFTGLDSNGSITADSSQIASYMIGDNSGTSGNGLVSAPTVLSVLKIPETHNGKPVQTISGYAFYNCINLVEVNIGNKLTTIEWRAFWVCSGIKKLTIGNKLTSIGQQAFFNCSNLKTVIYNNTTDVIKQIYGCGNWTELQINPDNEKYKVIDNILYSKDGTKLEKVPSGFVGKISILESVTNITSNAFYTCDKLTEVDIGDNLTTIEWRAFWCSGIKKLTLGSGLTNIGTQAFFSCSNLKTVIIDSPTIAANLSAQSSYENLVNYATTVYTKTTPGAYILNNFNVETSDIEGYTKYVKK